MLEKWATHYIDPTMLPEGAIIVDAGACRGDFIKEALDYGHIDWIYAFEPSTHNMEVLRDKDYSRVRLYEKALGGDHEVEFGLFTEYIGYPEHGNLYNKYLTSNHGGHDYSGPGPGCSEICKYNVPIFKTHQLISLLGLNRIDYLKMDVEGAELGILKSLTPAHNVQQISFEVHDQEEIPDMVELLENLDMTVEIHTGEIYAVTNGTD